MSRHSKKREVIFSTFRNFHQKQTRSADEHAVDRSKELDRGDRDKSRSRRLFSNNLHRKPLWRRKEAFDVDRCTRAEKKNSKTLEEVSDMVCLAAEQGVDADVLDQSQAIAEEQTQERVPDYESLYSQVLLPSCVSSPRQRSQSTASPLQNDGLDLFDAAALTQSPVPPRRQSRRGRILSVEAEGSLSPSCSDTLIDAGQWGEEDKMVDTSFPLLPLNGGSSRTVLESTLACRSLWGLSSFQAEGSLSKTSAYGDSSISSIDSSSNLRSSMSQTPELGLTHF